MARTGKNDKGGWSVTQNKVVKYSYIHECGSVCRADNIVVGNIFAEDFLLYVP